MEGAKDLTMTMMTEVHVYSDGACLGNPGPGGYGSILVKDGSRRYFSGGFILTTNNRMELLGAILPLESLEEAHEVLLVSDSRYVVDSISKGWVRKWHSQGWRTSGKAT